MFSGALYLIHYIHMLKAHYTVKDFLPLIVIFAGICAISAVLYLVNDMDILVAMRAFMAGFFLVFGALKVLRLNAFAEAYRMYDLLAKRSVVYAYLYPFIELGLGLLYAFGAVLLLTNSVTLVVMLFSALGVYLQLRKGETIMCACLGTVFKVPMTWVTLFEDLLMAAMALAMVVWSAL